MPASRRAFLSSAVVAVGALTDRKAEGREPHTSALELIAAGQLGKVHLIRVSCDSQHSNTSLGIALDGIEVIRRRSATGRIFQASPFDRQSIESSFYAGRDTLCNLGDLLLHVEGSGPDRTTFYGADGTLAVSPDGWMLHRPNGSAISGQIGRTLETPLKV